MNFKFIFLLSVFLSYYQGSYGSTIKVKGNIYCCYGGARKYESPMEQKEEVLNEIVIGNLRQAEEPREDGPSRHANVPVVEPQAEHPTPRPTSRPRSRNPVERPSRVVVSPVGAHSRAIHRQMLEEVPSEAAKRETTVTMTKTTTPKPKVLPQLRKADLDEGLEPDTHVQQQPSKSAESEHFSSSSRASQQIRISGFRVAMAPPQTSWTLQHGETHQLNRKKRAQKAYCEPLSGAEIQLYEEDGFLDPDDHVNTTNSRPDGSFEIFGYEHELSQVNFFVESHTRCGQENIEDLKKDSVCKRVSKVYISMDYNDGEYDFSEDKPYHAWIIDAEMMGGNDRIAC